MLFSKMLIPTRKEAPANIDILSMSLMIRAGMLHRIASGIYEFLPIGVIVLRKIENIIRKEMNLINGQEIILPLLTSKNLLMKTNRWNSYGKELFKLKDRRNNELCLTPTAEEVVTNLIKREINSYKQLPIMLYQFGTKFRDEIRPRFGIIRSREFLMKDAYSFHKTESDLNKYYKIVLNSYNKIYRKCNIDFKVVKACSGDIGGFSSHEFIAKSDSGEENFVWCNNCKYGASHEKADYFIQSNEDEKLEEIKKLSIPNNLDTTISIANFLNVSITKFIKISIYIVDNILVLILLRYDHEINELKLKKFFSETKLTIASKNIYESLVVNIVNNKLVIGFNNKYDNITKILADYSLTKMKNAIIKINKNNYVKNINYNRDYKVDSILNLRNVTKQDICPKCKKEKLKFYKGIEIGHTFKLGDKYSKLFDTKYLDTNGKKKLIIMGCYGIGIARVLATIIEQHHDKDGIIWPYNIAPFHVIIIPITYNDKQILNITEKIYKELSLVGLDVLIDDREERSGVKFKDADLLGIPYRIIINSENLLNNNVELKLRSDTRGNIKLVNINCILHEILKKHRRQNESRAL
ncbi:MAG: proline--tRNA ligase [Endomicrobium sp.]|nr:proline--tRNA ligase [Endomicrobium sp.]